MEYCQCYLINKKKQQKCNVYIVPLVLIVEVYARLVYYLSEFLDVFVYQGQNCSKYELMYIFLYN